MITAWKLFKQRKDGTLGPLFINCRQRVTPGVWHQAEAHRRKGFAFRPGWHVTATPNAPHLTGKPDRVWRKVLIEDYRELPRPPEQGGMWYLANRLLVLPT